MKGLYVVKKIICLLLIAVLLLSLTCCEVNYSEEANAEYAKNQELENKLNHNAFSGDSYVYFFRKQSIYRIDKKADQCSLISATDMSFADIAVHGDTLYYVGKAEEYDISDVTELPYDGLYKLMKYDGEKTVELLTLYSSANLNVTGDTLRIRNAESNFLNYYDITGDPDKLKDISAPDIPAPEYDVGISSYSGKTEAIVLIDKDDNAEKIAPLDGFYGDTDSYIVLDKEAYYVYSGGIYCVDFKSREIREILSLGKNADLFNLDNEYLYCRKGKSEYFRVKIDGSGSITEYPQLSQVDVTRMDVAGAYMFAYVSSDMSLIKVRKDGKGEAETF